MTALFGEDTTFDPRFNELRKLYPRRPNDRKQAAYEIWIRLRKNSKLPAHDRLLAAVEAFAKDCKRRGTDPQYIPHMRTWLNQAGYVDFLPPEAEPPADTPPHFTYGTEGWGPKLVQMIGPKRWRLWFEKSKYLQTTDTIQITVPSRFERDRIEAEYSGLVERLSGKAVVVRLDASGTP